MQEKNPLSAVVGVKTVREDWSFVLELFYRQEGCNSEEQEAFIDYFKNSGQAGPPGNHLRDELLRRGLLRYYLGASLAAHAIRDSRFSAGAMVVCSFQPETARFSNYASWLLLAEIGYEITQNSTLSFYIQKIGGGKYGEFNNLLPYRQSFTLLLKYFF
ncbi:MAG: hypothetical protein GX036_05055 [Firmicutes bacterium]|jgi:hypothetical protein|nr:hypothetical protein [Bacillota bacterium]